MHGLRGAVFMLLISHALGQPSEPISPTPSPTPTPTQAIPTASPPGTVAAIATPPPLLSKVLKHVLSVLAASPLTKALFNETATTLTAAFGDLLNVDPASVVVMYLGGTHRRLLASSGMVAANVSYATYDDARQAAADVSASALAAAVMRAGSPQLSLVSVSVDGDIVQRYDMLATSDAATGYYYVSVYWLGAVTVTVIAVLVCLLCFKDRILSGCRRRPTSAPKSEVIPCAPFDSLAAEPTVVFDGEPSVPPGKPLPELPGSPGAEATPRAAVHARPLPEVPPRLGPRTGSLCAAV